MVPSAEPVAIKSLSTIIDLALNRPKVLTDPTCDSKAAELTH